ncbi:RNA-processing protein [Candidatus Woesearchaeota archaeon]|nr:RNA-processing protein [Candidatus Woesearchaeota archaeon]
MDQFSYELKIPKERLAVLIGSSGRTKRELEKSTKTTIRVDSKEGDIFIYSEDGLHLYTAAEIVKAIGRGFNPNIAKLLLKSDYAAEQFDMGEFAKTRKHAIRLKGRVIGEEGKARRIIEELTECHVSVYGKTISIIGEAEKVAIARRAIESLLNGSPHSTVYKWLEKQRRNIKKKRIMEELS